MRTDEFSFDTDVNDIKTSNIRAKGWYPVDVEFGFMGLGQSSAQQLCWRVKGTEHVFRIPLKVFYEHDKGDYEGHFEKVLEQFRIDYLDWYKGGFQEAWMQNYRKQFKNYIYTFE